MPTNMTSSPRKLLLTIAFVLASAVPVSAQQPQQSDLQALRYYLDQENEAAVASELRRLQIQFPEWTPPEDRSELLSENGPDNINQIYRLIESGDFDQARALIAQTDAAFESWSPPADLLDLLSLSEAQTQFSAAVEAQQAETAIGIARGIPALMSCERVNNAWELAEMHLLLGDTARALSIFRSVIGSCAEPDILISTLEKADVVTNLEELESLADLALSEAPDAASQIRSVENRLRAGRQVDARWPNDERAITIDDEDLPESEATAPSETALTPEVESPPARPEVSSTSPSPQSQSAAPATAAISAVQAAAQRGAWGECLALSAGSNHIDVIYQRGWCAYNAERPMEAITSFQRAAQQGSSASIRRDATYGWMLALLKLNMTEQAAQIAVTVALTHEQRVEIEGQILDQRGVRAFERREFTRAIAFFDAHAQLTGSMRRDLGLLKGYALLNLGNRAAARDIFLQLHRQLATAETRRAMRAVE